MAEATDIVLTGHVVCGTCARGKRVDVNGLPAYALDIRFHGGTHEDF